MPIFSGYINIQSSSMFESEPTLSAIIACIGWPSLRTSPPSRKLSSINGDSARIIERYVTTSRSISGVLPKNPASGRINAFPSAESAIPTAMARHIACIAHAFASPRSPCASESATITPLPAVMAIETAIMNSSIGTATPAAAMASLPSRLPMNTPSTIK